MKDGRVLRIQAVDVNTITILFVVLGYGSGLAAISQEFADERACKVAATYFSAQQKVHVAACFPKSSNDPIDQLKKGSKK